MPCGFRLDFEPFTVLRGVIEGPIKVEQDTTYRKRLAFERRFLARGALVDGIRTALHVRS